VHREDLTILLDKGIKVRMLLPHVCRPPPLIIGAGNESIREAALLSVISSSGEGRMEDCSLALLDRLHFVICEGQGILPFIKIFL
jgi:hypothetical protein